MPLTALNCAWTQVTELSPLKDMKLTTLNCPGPCVSDLSLLRGMPLKQIRCDFKPGRAVRQQKLLGGLAVPDSTGSRLYRPWPPRGRSCRRCCLGEIRKTVGDAQNCEKLSDH